MNEKSSADRPSKSASAGSLSSEAPVTDTETTSKRVGSKSDESVSKSNSEDVTESTETFGIDDAIDAAGYGKFQKLLTFLVGLGWLADAFEIIILSIIGDMLACDWTMQRWQNALMTSVVFAGMTIGAPTFGMFADRFGRRMSLAVSMLLLFIFGASSSASPDYIWMVVLRAFMGFSLGGLAQGVTLCCEYYPASVRGRTGFYLSYYWALGTIGLILTAWVVMSHVNNWRVFVFVAAVPALIVVLVMRWYPESARYYLVSNQPEKALTVLTRMMKMNNKELPRGRLVEMEVAEQRGKITDLLKPKLRRSTLLFWYIWFAVACAYYGIALITPFIIIDGSLLVSSAKHENRTFEEDFTEIMPCKKFTHKHFLDLFWTSAAEFPGLIIFTFTVECCSRRIFLGATCVTTGFLLLFLMVEMNPHVAILVVLFVIRALLAGIFQLLFIMTTEAFPTTLRASAMGTGSGCARLGGLIIPYVAQVIVIARPAAAIFALAILTALAGIAAFLLPSDTRGKHMTEYVVT